MSRPLRWISLALAILTALPIPLGILAGFHLWLSPSLFLQSLLAGAHLVPFSAFGLAVLLLVLWRERWFCRNVCPMGILCDAVSTLGRKGRTWESVPWINRYLAIFGLAAALVGAPVLAFADPMAIFYGGWDILHTGMSVAAWVGVSGLVAVLSLNLLFPRLWCARLCPLGGLQILVWDIRRLFRRAPATPSAGPAIGRRHLLVAASGLGLGFLARQAAGAPEEKPLRPPGALPEEGLKTTCCRCGNCARACPSRIIDSSMEVRDPLGLLTPRLDFSRAYCLPSCDACGKVCPTGAIAPFDADQKSQLFIGNAKVRLDDCWVVKGKECDRCVASCDYQAIRIGGGIFEPVPEVDVSKCVGCGACAVVCPPGVITIRR
jgi:ferredoxin